MKPDFWDGICQKSAMDCLPQLDPCRKHTIDEHVFKSIDALDAMVASPGVSMHD